MLSHLLGHIIYVSVFNHLDTLNKSGDDPVLIAILVQTWMFLLFVQKTKLRQDAIGVIYTGIEEVP